MAQRCCSYCGRGYDDREGPHAYKECEARLNEQIDVLLDQIDNLVRVRREVRALRSQGHE